MNLKSRNRWIDMGISLVFPRRCAICDEARPFQKEKICSACRKQLSYVREPRCKKCGKPINDDTAEYCRDCSDRYHDFDQGLSLFLHDKDIRKSLYGLKYKNKREYADFYAEEMAAAFGEAFELWKPEVMIPVPLHNKKLIKRGFNQSAVLAKKIEAFCGIPVDCNYLSRTKNTDAQKTLGKNERKKNLEKAFEISGLHNRYERVLLIDDIYTTGATIDSCAKVLKEAGVKRVFFVTASIGEGN